MIVQDYVGLFYGAREPSDKPLSHYIDDSPVPELDYGKVQTDVAYSQSKCPCEEAFLPSALNPSKIGVGYR